MDQHIRDFFSQFSDQSPRGNFHKVIALLESPDLEWSDVQGFAPKLCKGWWELSRLQEKDRIEFVFDYWMSQIPYTPFSSQSLVAFFNELDAIEVYLTQKCWDSPWDASLVYSLKKDRGFYRGMLPATEDDIVRLQTLFPGEMIPRDFIAFARIHNGFCKATDSTGVLKLQEIPECHARLQRILESKEPLVSSKGYIIEPKSLIPFYESFGLPCFQCFWSQWFPGEEVGNVWYSGIVHELTSTDLNCSSPENMAFVSFMDWLAFYLEKVV